MGSLKFHRTSSKPLFCECIVLVHESHVYKLWMCLPHARSLKRDTEGSVLLSCSFLTKNKDVTLPWAIPSSCAHVLEIKEVCCLQKTSWVSSFPQLSLSRCPFFYFPSFYYHCPVLFKCTPYENIHYKTGITHKSVMIRKKNTVNIQAHMYHKQVFGERTETT